MHSHVHSGIQSKIRKRKSSKKKTVATNSERTVQDSKQESSELDTEKRTVVHSPQGRADIQDYT